MRILIDLDESSADGAVVVVSFMGLRQALTRNRILELLATEQSVLAAPAAGASTRAPQPGEATWRVPPGNVLNVNATISHGSVSSRTKKIYDHAHDRKLLRPAHAGILFELIRNFDWIIPEHPNSRLDFHLREIRTWRGLTGELRDEIDRFLARYEAMRGDLKRTS